MANALFAPLRLGSMTLANCIILASMTRSRATAAGVPQPIMAQYYADRASAGLIVTEATQISYEGGGYPRTPGVHTHGPNRRMAHDREGGPRRRSVEAFMEFDVVDTTDPKLVQTVTDLETRGKSIVLSYCAMSNGLNQMVDDIMRRSEFGKVKVLRIWAHGTASVIGDLVCDRS